MDISKMTIQEIKQLFSGDLEISEEIAIATQRDSRAGVRRIYEQYCHQQKKLAQELKRLAKLHIYEENLYDEGYRLIAGIDEAGRGPLAGPVVAASVILPHGLKIIGINDSKKISAKVRDELAEEIKSKALMWSVGIVDVDFIDKFNILQAALKAMYDAVKGLPEQPDYLLIDAVKIPNLDIPQKPIIGGDGLSASIAAASIIAKTTRDKMMEEYHQLYPQYGFDKHKGYGTKEHVNLIEKYGPCPIHRTTFNLVKQYVK